MKKLQHLAVLSYSIALLYSSCKKHDTPTTYDCTGITPTYTTDVKPIMDASCATSGCHSASAKAAGKDLSSYESVKDAANAGSFMGSIQHLSGYTAMPKGASKLSDDKIKTLSCWIKNGMPQ